MRNSIKVTQVLVAFMALFASDGFGQDRKDSVQYSTDTTTVAVNTKNIQGRKISGKVVDAGSKAPLPGVSVSIAAFSATITNEKGEFQITAPLYPSDLQVSFQGYHTKLYPVLKDQVDVLLYPESFPSQFVTVNLPSGSKSLSRTVAAVTIQNTPNWLSNNETISSNYQGRLTGVNTIRRSGTFGVGADLFIRGFNSLYASNAPLYVVDGMIYDATSYGVSITAGHINNSLQYIDPRDISSVAVVKDAVQAAEYGSRAANGVVFVTTNHATDLATKIDFSLYSGFNQRPAAYPVMNSYDYRSYLSDILSTTGLSASQIEALPYMNDNASTSTAYYAHHNETDWQKEVFRNSYDQNYSLAISGGDNVAKYSLSLGYLKNQGITNNTNYQRYTTRFNSSLNLTQRLTGNVHLAFTYNLQDLKDQGASPLTNPIFLALVKAPFLNQNEVDAGGAVSPKLADVDLLGIGNPRSLIENGTNNSKGYRFFGSSDFNYRFSKTLSLSALLGITYDKNQERSFIPRFGVADETLNFNTVDSRLGTNLIRFYGIATEAKLNYNKTFSGIHALNATIGFRYNNNDSEQDRVNGFNSGTDQLVSIGNSDITTRIFNGSIGKWRTLNSFLKAEYGYAGKYLINGSIAVDGSSRFGNQIQNALTINDQKFGLFPAIGAAWLVSSESFMKDSRAVDLLKLRLSYGLTGNDDIGNYSARRSYASQNLIGLQGLVRGNLANPTIQWEAVTKFNGGLDAALFSERLSFSLDYWMNKTGKMLTMSTVTHVASGVNSFLSNNAAMKTSGFDLGMNARLLNNAVKWDFGVTLGKYKNEVTSLEAGPILSNFAGGTYITSVNNVANLFYGYRTNGVYATSASAAAEGLSIKLDNGLLVPFKAGDIRFSDLNGDKIINDDDRKILGNPNPSLFGSFNNSFSYKQVRLDALCTFVTGNDSYNFTRSKLEAGSSVYNQTEVALNRWRTEGQVTNVPRAVSGDPMGNSRFSDRWIEDGAYVRLRTLALTYSLPFREKAFKYLNVYVTANNVVTLTGYKGFDPEFSASGSIYTQGTDTTLEPQFRSVQLGVRLGL